MSEETFVYTACPGWGDHEFCAIKTIVKDGKILRTEKACYTGPEAQEGYICQKGIISARQPYNPDRLLYPKKRVGERGSGEWERITWEQALDEIAAKMLEIRDAYGPESIVLWSLPASVPPSFGLGGLLGTRFSGLWGMTDPIVAIGLDNGPNYAAFYTLGNSQIGVITDPANLDDCKYIIVWGANPVENQQRITKHLVEARSRGAKIVDVGLVFDATAAMADWFIPAKPGSDPALALGMAHIIVKNKWYAEDYLLEHTTMPFLLRKDSHTFLYNDVGGRYVWDKAQNKAVPTAIGKKEVEATSPALIGEFEVDGVSCETVFTALMRHLEQYDPASVSELTGVPEADIQKLTKEYAEAESSYIVGALGLRYKNHGESYRSFLLLGALMGQHGRMDGGVTQAFTPMSYPLVLNDDPITRPNGAENCKTNFMRNDDFVRQAKTGDPFPLKGLIVLSGNPVHNYPNRSMWIDEILPQMELVVDFDIWKTDTNEYADYVLPDCMAFERTELIQAGSYNHIVLQEPAIEPQGECRDAVYLFTELAKRVGLGEYFDKTAEEWLAIRLQTDYPLITGIDPPLTIERLKEEKVVRTLAPEFPKFNMWLGLMFATPSVRMEFYNESLLDLGHELPVFHLPYEVPSFHPNTTYPYQFFSGRQRFFMQSMFTDDPLMVELSGGKPMIRMNPVTAKNEGLADGDTIECYNDRGHMVAELKFDQAVPPGMVHAWFGWRKKQFEEGMYSELLVPSGGPEATDDLARRWFDEQTQGKVGSIYAGDGGSMTVGSWDTLWDCACAVRKVEQTEGGR